MTWTMNPILPHHRLTSHGIHTEYSFCNRLILSWASGVMAVVSSSSISLVHLLLSDVLLSTWLSFFHFCHARGYCGSLLCGVLFLFNSSYYVVVMLTFLFIVFILFVLSSFGLKTMFSFRCSSSISSLVCLLLAIIALSFVLWWTSCLHSKHLNSFFHEWIVYPFSRHFKQLISSIDT